VACKPCALACDDAECGRRARGERE
jgi:hypothetical protein